MKPQPKIKLTAWAARKWDPPPCKPNIARVLYLCATLASAGAASYFKAQEPAHFRGYCYSVI